MDGVTAKDGRLGAWQARNERTAERADGEGRGRLLLTAYGERWDREESDGDQEDESPTIHSHVKAVRRVQTFVLGNIGQDLPNFSRKLEGDRFSISHICIVIVHFRQRQSLLKQFARSIVPVVVDQFPRFGDIASGIRAKFGHIPHRVEEMGLLVDRTEGAPEWRVRSAAKKSYSGLLYR